MLGSFGRNVKKIPPVTNAHRCEKKDTIRLGYHKTRVGYRYDKVKLSVG